MQKGDAAMKKVGVIGLGIIGGSLVKAINRKGLSECIVAYNRNTQITRQALLDGEIHQAAGEIDNSFEGCELIFICLPVSKIPDIIQKLGNIVDKNCILSDVGSTKTDVVEAVRKMSISCPFIGGHPMAGSETSGYKASRHTLFENAYYVLTPFKETQTIHVDRLVQFIKNLGALPIVIDPSIHDYAAAAISHVPHVLASALVNTIQKLDGQEQLMHTLAAGGFKDITRIASSSPEIWESICLANRDNIIEIINELEKSIRDFKKILSREDTGTLYNFFAGAREYRDSFSERRVGALYKTYDIVVDVEDRPGVIATIAGELGRHGINIKNIGINNSREMEGGILEICFYDRENQEASADILKKMSYPVSVR